ncbi:MAG: aminotransferase class I/II-fold pyridoxal phosphate-dependent enzyme [Bacteroidia bacterium]|nr:aminotransferase class I/II-fold pyridoxal phosphate-dependent enzyme [Bacteroidia bacterium]MCZ2249867.1 aminotransferase class I/II-fold pyridoxal phosphate-dependent enzyme [Bacteroidia bacterium]
MIIDLRSDTVTLPGKAMLAAMHNAPLGDDVFNEDPTVNRLQEYAADMFGMEAALFCPSGTMTNQIAIKTHTSPGDELICDALSHIYNYEGGGISFNSGVQVRLLSGNNGQINATQVEEAINPNFDWLTKTSLVCLENTVNKAGGSIYQFTDIQNIKDVCLNYNLRLHLDGARLFNALVETGESPEQYGKVFDSVSICLSKGLGAPVGSILLGNTEFIARARRVRKVFGGGMRQAGVLAAAGIFALQNNVNRLKEDHEKAQEIGRALEKVEYVNKLLPVETNIVIFEVRPDLHPEIIVEALKRKNILCTTFGKKSIRMVTHMDISHEMCSVVCQSIQEIQL